MQNKTHSRALTVGLLIAWLIGTLAALPALAEPLQQGNLLVNGDMEGNYAMQDGINEVKMPNGWRAWWVEGGGSADWDNMRPEFDTGQLVFNRVHSGQLAVRYFKIFAAYTAGIYQTVGNITPGTNLEFTVWGHSWSCLDWDKCHDAAGNVFTDADPIAIHMKVGIDPYGGTDPHSANIVWSSELGVVDHYQQFRVQATAQADKVTVFTYANQDWPAQNQDTYWDDASLHVVGAAPAGGGNAGGNAPPPPSNWNGVSSVATYEPQADGRIIHTVRSGETLGGIAVAYGLENASAVCALNPDMLPGCRIIRPGEKLLVGRVDVPTDADASSSEATPPPSEGSSGGSGAPAPGDNPASGDSDEDARASAEGSADSAVNVSTAGKDEGASSNGSGAPDAPDAPAVVMASDGTICFALFLDDNEDGVRTENEAPLANGLVALLRGGQEITSYQTDGVNTTFCFEKLEPGMYTVRATAPSNYRFIRSPQLSVSVTAGVQQDLLFGAVPGEAASTVNVSSAPGNARSDASVEATSQANVSKGLPNILSKWVGLIVLSGCFALSILWVVWQVARRH